jgi:hypothetical protein
MLLPFSGFGGLGITKRAPISSQTAYNPPQGWRMGHDRGGFAPTTLRCPLVVAPASGARSQFGAKKDDVNSSERTRPRGGRPFKTARRSNEVNKTKHRFSRNCHIQLQFVNTVGWVKRAVVVRSPAAREQTVQYTGDTREELGRPFQPYGRPGSRSRSWE